MRNTLFALAGLTVTAFAQATPEEAAEIQLKAMRDADWTKFTATMHPSATERFHTLMVQAAEAATNSTNPNAKRAMDQVFGGLSAAKIKAMKPAAFFEMFMKNFSNGNPGMLDHYRKSEVKFVGHVDAEGAAYVVSTITRAVGDNTVKAANTGVFLKEGEVWKSGLSGELEMLASGMIVQFGKK
jgi:hypothetical protein